MDTDSLYLALAKKELEDCIKPEMRVEWHRLGSNHCVDSFTADAIASLFPRTCCVKHKQHDKREPGFFKQEFRCTEMLCLCSKTYCCYDVTSDNFKFHSKVSTNAHWNRAATYHWKKYRRILNEKINVTSNNRELPTNNHSLAAYEHV